MQTPSSTPRGEVTRLLEAHKGGDPGALNALFPLVYDEIRRLARRERAGSRADTLDTTALVHEAYLKIAHFPGAGWENRAHFFAVASKVMRQVIVDNARRRLAQKRGGGAIHVAFEDGDVGIEAGAEQVLEVDKALDRLSAQSERLGQVVELRFFCGLSVDETAETLGVTSRTIKRDWRKARAFLFRELQGDAFEGPPA